MSGINGNWRLPTPAVYSHTSSEIVCKKCFQIGHISSGCRVWIHWSSYSSHRQPVQDESTFDQPTPVSDTQLQSKSEEKKDEIDDLKDDEYDSDDSSENEEIDDEKDTTMDETSEESEDLEHTARSLKTPWCYNCSIEEHTMEICPFPPDPVAVHSKLLFCGAWDVDDDENELDPEDVDESSMDDKLQFIGDHFG